MRNEIRGLIRRQSKSRGTVNNTTDRWGGTVIAAVFRSRFRTTTTTTIKRRSAALARRRFIEVGDSSRNAPSWNIFHRNRAICVRSTYGDIPLVRNPLAAPRHSPRAEKTRTRSVIYGLYAIQMKLLCIRARARAM